MYNLNLNFNNREVATLLEQIAFDFTHMTLVESRGISPSRIRALGDHISTFSTEYFERVLDQIKHEDSFEDLSIYDCIDDYEVYDEF